VSDKTVQIALTEDEAREVLSYVAHIRESKEYRVRRGQRPAVAGRIMAALRPETESMRRAHDIESATGINQSEVVIMLRKLEDLGLVVSRDPPPGLGDHPGHRVSVFGLLWGLP
jgi:DNA-binding transcriptional regulator GbsR (MarR family)